jgi:hypothetical protein
MNYRHEVISAFLDDDPYELADLAAALDEPAGRALLVDLLALRRIVQPADTIPMTPAVHLAARRSLRPVLAVAAVVVALIGGYAMGTGRARTVDTAAPPPTRIVQVTSTGQGLPSEVR